MSAGITTLEKVFKDVFDQSSESQKSIYREGLQELTEVYKDDWILNVLHQKHSKHNGGFDLYDSVAFLRLKSMMATKNLFCAAFKAKRWAAPDSQILENEKTLTENDAVELISIHNGPGGHDGMLRIAEDLIFSEVPVNDRDNEHPLKEIIIKKGCPFALEIGDNPLKKSTSIIMGVDGFPSLARLPYPIHSAPFPLLVLFVSTGGRRDFAIRNYIA